MKIKIHSIIIHAVFLLYCPREGEGGRYLPSSIHSNIIIYILFTDTLEIITIYYMKPNLNTHIYIYINI